MIIKHNIKKKIKPTFEEVKEPEEKYEIIEEDTLELDLEYILNDEDFEN